MSGLEVIGSVASVLQLAATVYSISKTLYEVGDALSNAPSDIKDLARDLETFSEELHLLSSLLSDKTHHYSDRVYQLTAKIIGDCASICVKIDRILRKLRCGSFLARVKWVFKEKEIMKLLARLRDLKLSLMGTLSLLSALKADHMMDAMGVGNPSLLDRPKDEPLSKETVDQVEETRKKLAGISVGQVSGKPPAATTSGATLIPSVSQSSEKTRPFVESSETPAQLHSLSSSVTTTSLTSTSAIANHAKGLPQGIEQLNAPVFISAIALPKPNPVMQMSQAMASVQSFYSTFSRHETDDIELTSTENIGNTVSNSIPKKSTKTFSTQSTDIRVQHWKADIIESMVKRFGTTEENARAWAASLPAPSFPDTKVQTTPAIVEKSCLVSPLSSSVPSSRADKAGGDDELLLGVHGPNSVPQTQIADSKNDMGIGRSDNAVFGVASVDRKISTRSVMTLPTYNQTTMQREHILAREGENGGADVVIEYPTSVDQEDARRDGEMEALYQLRLGRRQEVEEREERRKARREARERGDNDALMEIQGRKALSSVSTQGTVKQVRAEHSHPYEERARVPAPASYASLGLAKHDGTRSRKILQLGDSLADTEMGDWNKPSSIETTSKSKIADMEDPAFDDSLSTSRTKLPTQTSPLVPGKEINASRRRSGTSVFPPSANAGSSFNLGSGTFSSFGSAKISTTSLGSPILSPDEIRTIDVPGQWISDEELGDDFEDVVRGEIYVKPEERAHSYNKSFSTILASTRNEPTSTSFDEQKLGRMAWVERNETTGLIFGRVKKSEDGFPTPPEAPQDQGNGYVKTAAPTPRGTPTAKHWNSPLTHDSGSLSPVSDDHMASPPISTASKRGKPAALRLVPLSTKYVGPTQPSDALQSLKSASFITAFNQSIYPADISTPKLNGGRYDVAFLLQFKEVCTEKPSSEFESQIISLFANEYENSPRMFYRSRFGKVSTRGRPVVGGAALGAIGAEIITRARSRYREGSEDQSQSSSRSDIHHYRNELKASFGIAGVGLAAKAALKYARNSREAPEIIGRGRSRTRSTSRRRTSYSSYSSDEYQRVSSEYGMVMYGTNMEESDSDRHSPHPGLPKEYGSIEPQNKGQQPKNSMPPARSKFNMTIAPHTYKRHLAEGALAGSGGAALQTSHRRKTGHDEGSLSAENSRHETQMPVRETDDISTSRRLLPQGLSCMSRLAPTRQRSKDKGCGLCWSRKVKCDKKQPKCGRCTRLDLDCTWMVGEVRLQTRRRGYGPIKTRGRAREPMKMELAATSIISPEVLASITERVKSDVLNHLNRTDGTGQSPKVTDISCKEDGNVKYPTDDLMDSPARLRSSRLFDRTSYERERHLYAGLPCAEESPSNKQPIERERKPYSAHPGSGKSYDPPANIHIDREPEYLLLYSNNDQPRDVGFQSSAELRAQGRETYHETMRQSSSSSSRQTSKIPPVSFSLSESSRLDPQREWSTALTIKEPNDLWLRAFAQVQAREYGSSQNILRAWAAAQTYATALTPSEDLVARSTAEKLSFVVGKAQLQLVEVHTEVSSVTASSINKFAEILKVMQETLQFKTGAFIWTCLCSVEHELLDHESTAQVLNNSQALADLSEIATLVARYNVLESMYQQWAGMSLEKAYEQSLIELCIHVLRYLDAVISRRSPAQQETVEQRRDTSIMNIRTADAACRGFSVTIVSGDKGERMEARLEDVSSDDDDSDSTEGGEDERTVFA
ncbi:Sterol uptake control 2 [Hyphodiscus hymeniophilus]|uniref:Sterol uptake control 2 n=1 Tax=Hyphodiscus hymeniophilus TaxID=353542 RepID=A0A9P6SNL2_9HELO|nr:Sterol uptake control 2 [Hyphodiscus hymeniophilus]